MTAVSLIAQMANLDSRGEGVHGETPSTRTAYTIISLFCMSLLTGLMSERLSDLFSTGELTCIGHRLRHTKSCQLKDLCLTQALILLLYLVSMAFVLSAAVVESGLSLQSHSTCLGAIILCLAFYVGSKCIMSVNSGFPCPPMERFRAPRTDLDHVGICFWWNERTHCGRLTSRDRRTGSG